MKSVASDLFDKSGETTGLRLDQAGKYSNFPHLACFTPLSFSVISVGKNLQNFLFMIATTFLLEFYSTIEIATTPCSFSQTRTSNEMMILPSSDRLILENKGKITL